MFLRTQIRKYATEWIEKLPKGTVLRVYKLYDFLAETLPLRLLSPLQGWLHLVCPLPTACAVGCILAPLRGSGFSYEGGVKYPRKP